MFYPRLLTSLKSFSQSSSHSATSQSGRDFRNALTGEADIGIATESLTTEENLASVPYYTWEHSIITPQHHPLTQLENIRLEDLANYPIITYHGGFTGRSKIDKAFEAANIEVDIVMSALDADVIKTYVELGMG